jgi:DNA helicase HerA-like ATPase
MQIQFNQRVAIFGKTRSGKSYFAKSLLLSYPRICVHDRKHEHFDLIQRYHFSPVKTPEELILAIQKNKKRIIYQPADPSTEDFDEVCRIIFATGNICLVVDEAASYVSATKIPFWFGEILRLGALRGIGVISISQRPRAIHNTIISESEYIFAFRLHLKTDRDKLREVIGEEVETLRQMPYYHFMVWDGDEVRYCEPILEKYL